MKKKEEWVVFSAPNGKELCSYTVAGTFEGELQATIDLLAAEYKIAPKDITVKIHKY